MSHAALAQDLQQGASSHAQALTVGLPPEPPVRIVHLDHSRNHDHPGPAVDSRL